MIKKTIKYFLYFLILITIGVFYLSYYGIETKKFNQVIKDKISEANNKIDIELNKVKIIFNLSNFTIGIKTKNPNIIFENNKIKLETIGSDFSIGSFFKKEFAINNAKITTKENSLKDIIKIARIFKNTPQLFILNKMTKEGVIIADIVLNFDDKGKLANNYNIKGSIRDGKIRLHNKKNINNISFDFNIKDKQYLLESSQIEYEKLKLSSKRIEISNKEQYFLFAGDVSIPKSLVDSNLLSVIFKNNLENIGINNVNAKIEFFKMIVENFEYISIFSNDSFEMEIMTKEEFKKELIDFKFFRIRELGYKLRDKIIEQWTTIGNYETIEDNYIFERQDEISTMINTVIGNKFIPTYPLYIISLLQQIEAKTSNNLGGSAYSEFYSFLINQSLGTTNIKPDELDFYHTYLSFIAYNFFKD